MLPRGGRSNIDLSFASIPRLFMTVYYVRGPSLARECIVAFKFIARNTKQSMEKTTPAKQSTKYGYRLSFFVMLFRDVSHFP